MRKNKIITLLIVLITAIIFYYFGIRFCPLFNLFHIPCPGCGLTRALKLLLKGKILESLKYNILILPISIIVIIYVILLLIKKEHLIENFAKKHKKIIIVIAIILTLITWIINIFNDKLY
ncbi:MAG: DUF2752 domain-containing protein [Bacilli bacterium]|nr:DUF2752 domain-containing protein [Bacilli bacterium]